MGTRKSEGILGALFGGAGQTSIRGGFGMVYDNVGESLINTFDQNGAFGLSTSLSNPAGSESVTSSPRLTDMHTIPATDLNGGQILLPAPPGQFPQTFPSTLSTGGFAIAWGLDNTIKTPYAYTLDLSMSRQLKNGFSVEARIRWTAWPSSDGARRRCAAVQFRRQEHRDRLLRGGWSAG